MKAYLVMSANTTEFKKVCKRFKVKGTMVPYFVESQPLFAFRTKKEAIKECRENNNYTAENEYDVTHYIREISIY